MVQSNQKNRGTESFWWLSHPKIQQPSINFHGMDTRLQPNHTTCLCASSPKQILFTQPMTLATICSDNHFQSLFTLITAQNPHKNIAQLQRLRWKLPLRLEVRKFPKWSPKDPWEWYIYLLIYHKKQQNVGKYTIHGSYGVFQNFEHLPKTIGFRPNLPHEGPSC